MKRSHLVLGALGAAAVGTTLLFTTDKGKGIRNNISGNLDDWKKRLQKMAKSTTSELSDLQRLVSREVEGLGDDARQRIQAILDESASTAKELKGKMRRHLNA